MENASRPLYCPLPNGWLPRRQNHWSGCCSQRALPACTEHLKIWKGTLSLMTGLNHKLYPLRWFAYLPLPLPNKNVLNKVLAKSPACSMTPPGPGTHRLLKQLIPFLDSSVKKVFLLFSWNLSSGDFTHQSQSCPTESHRTMRLRWEDQKLWESVRLKFWLYSLPAMWPF